MLETSARLFRLLWLLQTRRYWSGEALSQALEIEGRTVRRDVAKLRALGYDIEADPGPGGGYRMGARRALPPIQLDDDEAVAVAVGLGTQTGSDLAEVSVRLLTRLEQALPERLQRRVAALRGATFSLAPGTGVEPGVLSTLANACHDPQRLTFAYRSHGGVESERLVEPYRLGFTGRQWYLVAWDVERSDWRTFRVDRIQRPVRGSPFEPVPQTEAELQARLREAISSAPYPVRAVVILHAAAEVVRARLGPNDGVVEAIDEARCRLTSGAASAEHLAVHLALMGWDFEVETPLELREHLERLGRRCLRAARVEG